MRTIFILCSFVIFATSCTDNHNKEEGVKHQTKYSSDQSMLKEANEAYDNNNYVRSKAFFDTLIQHDSLNGQYYFRRGYSEALLIEKYKAIKDFKRAISLKYKVAPSYFNLGINYSFYNDSLALYYFEKSLETDPSSIDAYLQAADCKKRIKEHHAHFYNDTLFTVIGK